MSEESKKSSEKVAIITVIGVVVAAIITAVIGPIIVEQMHKTVPTITPIITTEAPSIAAITTPLFICPYQGQTDNETISSLIQAEAVAANTKDLSIILAIFDPNALFYDCDPTRLKQWNGPIERYRDDLFKTTDLQGVEHFDPSPVGSGIGSDIAYYVSGSKGNYRIGGGNWTYFFNGSKISEPSTQFGSEHWILKKDNNGCWVITQMEFNAGHIEFPKLP